MSTILIVDDDSKVARSILRMLEGNAVAIETHAPTAVARIMNTEWPGEYFDVVVCDVGMPNMSGLDVLQAILSRREPPIFILMSGDEDSIFGVLGADGVLAKPFQGSELRQLIATLRKERSRAKTQRLRRPMLEATSANLCSE